tara:strand:+ start:861 stop:1454 length:594 start_codon:yes stop_codon:yes gene_type:complete
MPDYRPTPDQLNEMMNEPPPESPVEAAMTPMELEGLAAAEDADLARDETFESVAPEGAYSVDALNDLVGALNEVLPLFEVESAYPSFGGPVSGPLPADFVAQLSMVSQAATDAGMERLAPDLDAMGDDGGLDKAARQIETLAGNQNFITFLKTNRVVMGPDTSQAPPPVNEGLPAGQDASMPAPSDVDMDQMFAGRM